MSTRLEGWLAECNQRPHLWLGLVAALLAAQISPWWYPAPDSVAYLSIARSIVNGAHIGRLGSYQLAFPPGYPLLISPAFLVSERPFLLLSAIHWGMAVVFMLGVYAWARQHCPAAALLITGLVMVNVSVWVHYHRILSELPFMTVAIWTVLILDAALQAQSGRTAWRWAIVGSFLMVLLGMIREVGVIFGAGFAVALLLDAYRGQRRWSATIALMLIVVLPAVVAVAVFTRYDTVMAQRAIDQTGTHWDGLVRPAFEGRFTEGLRLRISDIGRLTIPGMYKAYGRPGEWLNVNLAIYVPLCLFIAFGWWRFVHRQQDVFALTLPLYLGAYVAWPFDSATRYVLPLLPALLACLWFVLESRRWRLTFLATLLMAHLVAALGYWTVIEIPRVRECNAEWRSVEQLAGDVRENSQTVLAANLPACAWLMLDFTLDRPVRVARDWVAADADVRWIIMPQADSAPPGFREHTRTGRYKLLARDRDR